MEAVVKENNLLELQNLCFKFPGQPNLFFNKISVGFASGKIHFICGRNGVGKSVFFRILQGNFDSTELATGTYFLDGKEYEITSGNRVSGKYSNQIALVCQKFDHMLADRFTVKQNLQLANIENFPSFSFLPDHKQLPVFFDKFGIELDKPVYLLSGGQRQILATMMMLQNSTKILLMDEPTAALDDHNSDLVFKFLKNMAEKTGLTVLVITHDSDLVDNFAQNYFYQILADEVSGERFIVKRDKGSKF
jgi:ABC-type lipoprotein export system ATPase subunit